jgi:hypothetical protein
MKYCKKCKKDYSDEKRFCEDCGNTLVEFVEKIKKPIENKNTVNLQWMGFTIIAICCFVFLILFSGSFTGSYTRSSNIQTSSAQTTTEIQKKCVNVQEPYTVQVPYMYSYSYSVVSSEIKKDYSLALGEYTVAKIVVSNNENSGGNFEVDIIFNVDGSSVTRPITKYIPASSTETFQDIYDNKLGQSVSGTYKITPPTETRYTTETRYRTVQKCE